MRPSASPLGGLWAHFHNVGELINEVQQILTNRLVIRGDRLPVGPSRLKPKAVALEVSLRACICPCLRLIRIPRQPASAGQRHRQRFKGKLRNHFKREPLAIPYMHRRGVVKLLGIG